MVEGGSIRCGLPLRTGPGLWKPVTTFIFTLAKAWGWAEGFCFNCTPEASSSSIDFSVAWADFSAKYRSTVPSEHKSMSLESYFV